MTGASVNFKAVKSAGHAVSHASREVAPTYLLPTEKSMGTVVLLDDKGRVSQVLDAKMALASPRAKVDKRYSPVWEGILNLRRPEPGEDAEEYRAECSAVVTDWYKQYEASTGHKVLRVDVHLDEGHMVDGEAVLNAHAHVIADRTNDLGRVIKLSPKQLRELQTMTAEVTSLERGKSSFETGRKHINHHAYKHLAERGRLETQQVKGELDKSQSDLTRQRKLSKEWSDADLGKVKDLKAEIAQLKAQYTLDRDALKATGEATQRAYQALKAAHDGALAELKSTKEKVGKMEKKIVVQDAELVDVKAKFAAMATEYQAHRDAGKPAVEFVPDPRSRYHPDNIAKQEAQEAATAAAKPAPRVMPSPAPSTPTRGAKPGLSEGSQGVSTASLHGPRAIEQPKTPPEQPKTKNPDIPTPEPEKSHLEAFKASMKVFFQGWVDFIKSKGFTHAELDASKGQYRGKILDTDDVFAMQKTGRDTCVIHWLSDLDTTPDLDNPDIFIRYQDGRGQVTGQLDPEKYPRPGVGR